MLEVWGQQLKLAAKMFGYNKSLANLAGSSFLYVDALVMNSKGISEQGTQLRLKTSTGQFGLKVFVNCRIQG